MNVFSKLNQIKELRQQGKNLQNQLAQETVTLEKQGVNLVMDGNQKIIKLDLNPELLTPERKTRLEEIIKELHNEAIGKVQRIMVEKMKASGNLNIPGLT
ncbi:MAG: YbaB/EbfC family nucleoid-associated protein [Candidatus Komeilibacteria bacterium]|nr:YbaB/EbfC family nucleoid-associated protein [Candidatus Komeilibacteria bacterium]